MMVKTTFTGIIRVAEIVPLRSHPNLKHIKIDCSIEQPDSDCILIVESTLFETVDSYDWSGTAFYEDKYWSFATATIDYIDQAMFGFDLILGSPELTPKQLRDCYSEQLFSGCLQPTWTLDIKTST